MWVDCIANPLEQGSPTLFLEIYRPVGFHSDPYLAHLILIISRLICLTRLVTTGVGAKTYRIALHEQGWRPMP